MPTGKCGQGGSVRKLPFVIITENIVSGKNHKKLLNLGWVFNKICKVWKFLINCLFAILGKLQTTVEKPDTTLSSWSKLIVPIGIERQYEPPNIPLRETYCHFFTKNSGQG